MTDIYPQYILDFWRRASETDVRLQLESPGEAIRIRKRLYSIRKKMRDRGHPLSAIAEGVVIRITGSTLVGGPALSEISSAFTQGLAEAGEAPTPLSAAETMEAAETLDPAAALEAIFKEPEPDPRASMTTLLPLEEPKENSDENG